MRLIPWWKALSIGLVVLAAAIYLAMVVHELGVRLERGAARHAQVEADHGSPDHEAMLGAIWAHEHHPYDATWCPDYSASFENGCAQALTGAGGARSGR